MEQQFRGRTVIRRDIKPDNVVELFPGRATNELPPTCDSQEHPELFGRILRMHVDKQTTDANNAYGKPAETVPSWAIVLVMAAVAFMLYYIVV